MLLYLSLKALDVFRFTKPRTPTSACHMRNAKTSDSHKSFRIKKESEQTFILFLKATGKMAVCETSVEAFYSAGRSGRQLLGIGVLF